MCTRTSLNVQRYQRALAIAFYMNMQVQVPVQQLLYS